METREAINTSTEATNTSMEDAGIHYQTCHLLKDEEKMQLLASRPLEGDVVNGKTDRGKICESLASLLPTGHQFDSSDHLKEFVLAFAGPWGFHVNTHAKTYLVCARNSRRKSCIIKAVRPDGEGRNRENVTKVECPFIVRSSLVIGTNANKKLRKDDEGKDHRVSINNNCMFLHNLECCPGILSMTNARTNSGFYTRQHINTENLISVVKLIELGGVQPRLLRAILRQHLPQNVPISSTQLHNFRVRAKLLVQSGKLDHINESDSKMMFDGLDSDSTISSNVAEQSGLLVNLYEKEKTYLIE